MKIQFSMQMVLTILVAIGISGCKPDTENSLDEMYNIYALLAANTEKQNITDNGNGTVSVISQNLTWAKCPQQDTTGANLYNPGSNDCSGGSAGLFDYCSASDSSCDNGTILNGAGTSGAWSTCANLTLTGRTWRVPTKNELKSFTDVATSAIFPGTVGSTYWSTDVVDVTGAWTVEIDSLFSDGGLAAVTGYLVKNKTSTNSVRCVSTGI